MNIHATAASVSAKKEAAPKVQYILAAAEEIWAGSRGSGQKVE